MAGQKLSDFEPLSDAEQKLVDACQAGSRCRLGDGKLPDGHSPERNIRADLLRFLILGGGLDCPVHVLGVRLLGAYVSGRLDLSFATAKGLTLLAFCRFESKIFARQTRFDLLTLSGSTCPGLNGEGISVTGDMFLRAGFSAKGEVNLSGAKIGGQLGCTDARFDNPNGHALNAQGIDVTADVFLTEGFSATGEVGLSGAKIGGQFVCTHARFENPNGRALNAHGIDVAGDVFVREGFSATGEVSLSGAMIGGQLSCTGARFDNPNGRALNADRMQVGTTFFWRQVTTKDGALVFSSAHVGDLVDDLKSWPKDLDALNLNGFSYDRILGSFLGVTSRLDWLARGTIWKGEFIPQPYSQLAKVYREMGHDREARLVLIEQSRLVRRAIRRNAMIVPNGDIGVGFRSLGADVVNALRWVGDIIQRVVTGYGYKPVYAIGWLILIWGATALIASFVWTEGSFAPNSDVILTSEAWTTLSAQDCFSGEGEPAPPCMVPNPADVWSTVGAAGMDWESFSPQGYAADLVVPVLDLGQTDAWAPSKDRGPWGWVLWWARWVLSAFGWIVSALGAAAVTGIIKRE